jgi:hypothetical protein
MHCSSFFLTRVEHLCELGYYYFISKASQINPPGQFEMWFSEKNSKESDETSLQHATAPTSVRGFYWIYTIDTRKKAGNL